MQDVGVLAHVATDILWADVSVSSLSKHGVRGAWLAELVEHVSFDPVVVRSRPLLGVELTLKINKIMCLGL